MVERWGAVATALYRGAWPALLVAALLFAACRQSTSDTADRAAKDPRHIDNVILISIDSLRADHLGAYGYDKPTSPALDALGARGVVFERAYSTTSWTLPSHVAMLSGRDDRAHGVLTHNRKFGEDVPTLAEELGKQGIGTVGFYSGPYLHPTFGFARGFDQYWNCSSVIPKEEDREVGLAHFASFKDETNPLILANLRRWLDAGGPTERNFIFIHMWDVHYSYTPPDQYVRMFDPDYTGEIDGTVYGDDRVHAGMDPRDLRHLIARYDGEIRYTDDTIAEILRMLEAAGLLVNAAVIVTADHGEEFFEHGAVGHQQSLFEEVLHIPLMIELPGRPSVSRRIDEVVSLIDIYPTICELFGVACGPASERSQSLADYLSPTGEKVAWRGDALANLSSTLTTLEVDALVTSEGKVINWHEGSIARHMVRTQMPNQILPSPSNDEAGDVALFFDRQAMAQEQRGEFVSEAMPDSPAKRTLQRLFERIGEAETLFAHTAGASDGAGSVELDDDMKERLRALGYIE